MCSELYFLSLVLSLASKIICYSVQLQGLHCTLSKKPSWHWFNTIYRVFEHICFSQTCNRFLTTGNSGGKFEMAAGPLAMCQTTSWRSPKLWTWRTEESPSTATLSRYNTICQSPFNFLPYTFNFPLNHYRLHVFSILTNEAHDAKEGIWIVQGTVWQWIVVWRMKGIFPEICFAVALKGTVSHFIEDNESDLKVDDFRLPRM